MTHVYSLLECCDGEVGIDIYNTMEKAIANAEELASMCDWVKVSAKRWEDPEDSTNYIEVQAQNLL